MNILFTICGRAGSKGIKNKNIKDFLGYPLPFYTVSVIDLYIKTSQDIKYNIVLNTDSDELISLFKEHLTTSVDIIKRDASLAQDNTPKLAVITMCLETMEKRTSQTYNMVVDLDITSPLRTVADLCALINTKKSSNADVVFSVTESRRNPYFNMVKKTGDSYKQVIESEFNTRQETPEVFDMNASLYAYSPDFLRSRKRLFEGKTDIIKMYDTAVLDLDHENDFELMQVIARYLYDNFGEFNEVRKNIANLLKR